MCRNLPFEQNGQHFLFYYQGVTEQEDTLPVKFRIIEKFTYQINKQFRGHGNKISKTEFTSMKLWNCVNILNISILNDMFPLSKIPNENKAYKIQLKTEEKKLPHQKDVLPRLIEVYMGITNNYWLDWITRNKRTELE